MTALASQHHKHCIFCGKSSDLLGLEDISCRSRNNPLPEGTCGGKPHVYLTDDPPPQRPKEPGEEADPLREQLEGWNV